MASKLQLTRGDLTGKQESTSKLIPAELFWQARTSDSDNKDDRFSKWDEGTLFIGRPSLNLDKTEEKPIPIAGARSYISLVHRGFLSDETSIQAATFKHAQVGDLYTFSNDAKSGLFKNSDDFRKDDLLLILDIGDDNVDATTGEIKDQALIRYKRINASGGYADDVYFHNNGENWPGFDANNVQDALLELNYQKVQYEGTIGKASQIPVTPVIGGVYLVTADLLTFNTGNDNAKEFSPDKGDFVYWKQTSATEPGTGYWVQIPSGYTNANEIDYYTSDRQDERELFISSLFTTFTDSHKELFAKSSDNVESMLSFLMAQKAQLDEQGKIPLSQLHDTVLGAIQFKGTWSPLKDGVNVDNDLDVNDGTMTIKKGKEDLVNPLPSYSAYKDGDTTQKDVVVEKVSNGDYYVVQLPADVINLQYTTSDGSVSFELNTNDWIVYCDSDAKDETSAGVSTKSGYWVKIDNSERLSAMQYRIDVKNKNNFFVTHPIDSSVLTLVGTPKLIAQNKIGLDNLGNNTVAITGRGLIDQLEYENPIPNFLPRYDNAMGTVKNSFIEEEGNEADNGDDRTSHFNDPKSTSVTRFHSNVEIGDELENRTTTCYGNVIVKPHIEQLDSNVVDKSTISFQLRTYDDSGSYTVRTVSLVPPDKGSSYGVDEDLADETVNLILPEHTSTIIGKLAGVELQESRILKSVDEGYAESSSIEEHINADDSTKNYHDSIDNVVEFHSQVSAPVTNSYEYYFGDWNTTDEGARYNDADFDSTGALNRQWSASKIISARLVKNTTQTNSNITVMLPVDSGTLLTEEVLQSLWGKDDDSFVPMYGDSVTLQTGVRQNTLKRSPIRQLQNALRARLLQSKTDRSSDSTEAEMQKSVASSLGDSFAASKGDGTFKSTTDTAVSDTVIENDVVVGAFDNDGNLKSKKSLVATNAIGLSDPDYGTVLINGARRNFPAAEQYYDPVTGDATLPIDVVVDAPNESGVMLTSNSVISGGEWYIKKS